MMGVGVAGVIGRNNEYLMTGVCCRQSMVVSKQANKLDYSTHAANGLTLDGVFLVIVSQLNHSTKLVMHKHVS